MVMCVMTPISPFSDWPHPRRHSVTQLGTWQWSVHTVTDLINRNTLLVYYSVKYISEPRSCVQWVPQHWCMNQGPTTDFTNANTVSVWYITVPQSCVWRLPSVHTDVTNGNIISVWYITVPRRCVWWLPLVHMVTDLTNGNRHHQLNTTLNNKVIPTRSALLASPGFTALFSHKLFSTFS